CAGHGYATFQRARDCRGLFSTGRRVDGDQHLVGLDDHEIVGARDARGQDQRRDEPGNRARHRECHLPWMSNHALRTAWMVTISATAAIKAALWREWIAASICPR